MGENFCVCLSGVPAAVYDVASAATAAKVSAAVSDRFVVGVEVGVGLAVAGEVDVDVDLWSFKSD